MSCAHAILIFRMTPLRFRPWLHSCRKTASLGTLSQLTWTQYRYDTPSLHFEITDYQPTLIYLISHRLYNHPGFIASHVLSISMIGFNTSLSIYSINMLFYVTILFVHFFPLDFVFKNLKIKIHKTIILPFGLYDCGIVSWVKGGRNVFSTFLGLNIRLRILFANTPSVPWLFNHIKVQS